MANSYLTRTPGSAGNTKKFTISAWVKRSYLGSNTSTIFSSWSADSIAGHFAFRFDGSDRLDLSTWSVNLLTTNRFFKDTNAWYHIVCAVDTDESTANNRVRFYVNGVEETSFSARNNPSSGQTFSVNNTNSQTVGLNNYSSAAGNMDGYMSHVAMVDGQQLTPATFGETDSTSGIWKFKSPSGVTWGTNGFHLKFENSGNLGLDSSGQTNNFTTNGNLRQAVDTPSNVYATWNPLIKDAASLSNGNTTSNNTSSSNWNRASGTLANTKGKYYAEFKMTTMEAAQVGIIDVEQAYGTTAQVRDSSRAYMYKDNGQKGNGGSDSSFGASFTDGDIIGIALDLDNNKIYFSKNGVWQNSGVPTSGSTGTGSAFNLTDGYFYTFVNGNYDSSGSGKIDANFGNGYFGTTAITSAGSNGNGSLFEYDVPSGYYALNTKNINTYG
jgi:hypothetical protein